MPGRSSAPYTSSHGSACVSSAIAGLSAPMQGAPWLVAWRVLHQLLLQFRHHRCKLLQFHLLGNDLGKQLVLFFRDVMAHVLAKDSEAGIVQRVVRTHFQQL